MTSHTQIATAIDGVNVKCVDEIYETEIILDDEELFKIKTLDALNKNDEIKNFVMLKSQNIYCSVDFTIINTQNLLSCYVEHKRKKINANDYPTFFIGWKKLIMISTYYQKQTLFLIFECDDDIYFTEFDERFLKRETKIIRGSKVVEINKTECGRGFEKLNQKLIENLTL